LDCLNADGDGAEYFGGLEPECISIPLRYHQSHEIQLQIDDLAAPKVDFYWSPQTTVDPLLG
jgi:hypothetical protein